MCMPIPAPDAPSPLRIADGSAARGRDDVGALCAAHALADKGEAELLAVVHSTGLDSGVGAVAAINSWYHRPVPLGAYRGVVGAPAHTPSPAWTQNGRGVYVDELVKRFCSGCAARTAAEVDDAVTVYLQQLRAAEERSVTIVCVGHATNLHQLLLHPEGAALVSRSVARLVIMGGRSRHDNLQQPVVEWNFGGCGGKGAHGSGGEGDCGGYDQLGWITNQTLTLWPVTVPISYIGFEVGADVNTGLALTRTASYANPCRYGYALFCDRMPGWCVGQRGRASWDPIAVVYAVRGTEGFYHESEGHNSVNRRNGTNAWRELPPGAADPLGSRRVHSASSPTNATRHHQAPSFRSRRRWS